MKVHAHEHLRELPLAVAFELVALDGQPRTLFAPALAADEGITPEQLPFGQLVACRSKQLRFFAAFGLVAQPRMLRTVLFAISPTHDLLGAPLRLGQLFSAVLWPIRPLVVTDTKATDLLPEFV